MINTSQQQVRRAIVASTIGTAIEWYDFILYGFAAALVFPQIFFPASDPFIGVLLAFSTYFVGFAARPIGAAIFGHYGDRIGRKSALVATLLLMGLSTFAVGLVPSYESIGIWGAVILTLLRTLQGIGIGGEWGGSVLMAMEWGNQKRRGFIASWPQFGVPVGLIMANGMLGFFNWFSGDDFLTWGWRIPFLVSIALVGVGLYIRVGVLETPAFSKLQEEQAVDHAPVVTVFKHHWREVLLASFARTGQQTAFYIFTTFILTYGTKTLGFERGEILNNVLIAACFSLFTIPLFGYLSDRWGRHKVYMIGAVALALYSFAYFALLDTKMPMFVLLAIALSMPIHDIQYGPQAAMIAEIFPDKVRYSGASLGYHLAALISGGPTPLIAVTLLQYFGSSFAIAVYLSISALIALVATAMIRARAYHHRVYPLDAKEEV